MRYTNGYIDNIYDEEKRDDEKKREIVISEQCRRNMYH